MRFRTPGAAAYLGLSPKTLEKWRLRGEGPRFLKLGRTVVVYDKVDLDAYMRECRRESTSDPGQAA